MPVRLGVVRVGVCLLGGIEWEGGGGGGGVEDHQRAKECRALLTMQWEPCDRAAAAAARPP